MTLDNLADRANAPRPWLFGVCAGLAPRLGYSVGVVRLVTVVMLSWLTIPAAIAYLATAFLMEETRERTQIKTARWARKADRFIEDVIASVRSAKSETNAT